MMSMATYHQTDPFRWIGEAVCVRAFPEYRSIHKNFESVNDRKSFTKSKDLTEKKLKTRI